MIRIILTIIISTVTIFPNQLWDSQITIIDSSLTVATAPLKNSNTVHANFIQSKRVEALNRDLITTGELIFLKDMGIIWRMRTPIIETIVMPQDGRIKVYDKDMHLIKNSSSSAISSRFSTIMQSIFSGDFSKLLKVFNLYFTDDNGNWELGLRPIKGEIKRALKQIVLTGDIGKISSFIITAPNGGSTTIKFSNQIINRELRPESLELLKNED